MLRAGACIHLNSMVVQGPEISCSEDGALSLVKTLISMEFLIAVVRQS